MLQRQGAASRFLSGATNVEAVSLCCSERASGDLVGEAGCADLLGHVVQAARDDVAAREDRVARRPGDAVGLAGDLRLVELGAPVAHDAAVDDELVAGAHLEQVAAHHCLGGDCLLLPVADDHGLRAVEQGDPVERALGLDLLETAHHDVDEDHPRREQGVHRAAEQQQSDAQGEERVVDEGEDALADDLAVAAGGDPAGRVGIAGGGAGAHLGGAQAARRLGSHNRLHSYAPSHLIPILLDGIALAQLHTSTCARKWFTSVVVTATVASRWLRPSASCTSGSR